MDTSSIWPLVLAAVLCLSGVVAMWLIRSARKDQAAGTDGRTSRSGSSRRSQVFDDSLDTVQGWEPAATRVLTSPERDAYMVLRRALPDHMILAQVPVARFIKVPTRNSYSEWLRRAGSLCADLVICDLHAQVLAVVEVRQPLVRQKDRAQKRHARLDRVLQGAGIPVHIWLEGSLPGPTVARDAILGSAVAHGHADSAGQSAVRRDAEAAALVAAMSQSNHGLVHRNPIVIEYDDLASGDRLDPPPSTWFDDLDSGSVPLDPSKRH